MFEVENLHLSLDVAREELQKRWGNIELRKKIEEELDEDFWPEFKDKPRGMLGRCLPSPDNGFTFFYQMAKYVGTEPLAIEYMGDMFVSVNPEKKGLGRLSLYGEKGEKFQVDIMNFHDNEKKKVCQVILKSGEKLIDFHYNLLKFSGYEIKLKDLTEWIKGQGKKPQDFYYKYLLHFVAHGVIFENFEAFMDDEKGIKFLRDFIAPIIDRIEKKFGLRPLVIRLYPDPESQDKEEDFYWWCYPPYINEHLIQYSKDNNLPLKIIKN